MRDAVAGYAVMVGPFAAVRRRPKRDGAGLVFIAQFARQWCGKGRVLQNSPYVLTLSGQERLTLAAGPHYQGCGQQAKHPSMSAAICLIGHCPAHFVSRPRWPCGPGSVVLDSGAILIQPDHVGQFRLSTQRHNHL